MEISRGQSFSQLPQRLEKKHSQPVSTGDDSGGEIPGDAFLNIQADGITGLIQIDLRDAGTAQGMVGGEKRPLISGNLVLFGEAVCFFLPETAHFRVRSQKNRK